jgi:signal transduction histidine kinase
VIGRVSAVLARHPRRVDGVMAGVLAIVAVLGIWLTQHQAPGHFRDPDAWAVLLALAATVPLAWRRQHPGLVLVMVAVAQLLYDIPGYPPGLALPAWMLAIYSFAVHRVRGAHMWPVAVLLATVASHAVIANYRNGAVDVAGWLVPAAAAWIVGDLVRARRFDVRVLMQRARQLELEREAEAAAAVAAERARIARELHDIIAHALGVIVMQAGGAGRIVGRDPSAARDALAAIEATGRDAFTQMRTLVGVLRIDGSGGLDPQPVLADLPKLVEASRGDRLSIELTVHGRPRDGNPAVELSAYRVVQEALTNCLKHAAPTAVEVRLCWTPRDLQVEVVDTGPRSVSARPAGAAGPGSGGYGLVGMRERAAVFGGELAFGPIPAGGFRVWARFPLNGAT